MNSDGLITAPVNVKADIAKVLATNNTNLSSLCTHQNINKYSKKKPVRYPNIPSRNTDWWKSIDGDCGLDVQLNNYLDSYKNDTAYAYKRPRGGTSEPYREADFDGYYHYAKPFIRTHITKGFLENINFAYVKYYRFSIDYIETSDTDLTFADLDSVFYNGIENVYIAYDVYNRNPITDSSAQLKRSVVNDISISNPNGRLIDIEFDESDVGQTIYVLLYLKDTQLPMTAPIPYDDNNYMLLSFKVTNLVGLSGDMINIAGVGESSWFSLTGSVSPSNAFSTNFGDKDIQIQTTLKNNNTSNDNITNYDFRLRVTGTDVNNQSATYTFTPTFLNGMNGSPIYSLSLPSSTTVTTVLSYGKIFQNFIKSTSNKFVNLYLDAKLKSSNDWYPIATRGLFIKQ